MIGIVNEDIHLKKGNSKKLSNVFIENSVSNSVSNSGLKTPSSIDEHEEKNIKDFINYENFDTNLQYELNSIISNIPQNNNQFNEPSGIINSAI